MPNPHYYGLILAGGRGTRFWPRSRKRSAKQVLNVVGERTLIQATVDRLTPVIAPERIWVLTNDHLRATIIKQLPEVPRNQILAEPVQRNTAPAIGLAANILHSLDPDELKKRLEPTAGVAAITRRDGTAPAGFRSPHRPASRGRRRKPRAS